VWLRRPDTEMIRAEVAGDDTGTALADMLRRERPARAVGRATVRSGRAVRQRGRFMIHVPGRTWQQYETQALAAVREFAEQGYDERNYNHRLNVLAVQLGHFIPEFLSYEQARDMLYEAAVTCGCVNVPPGHNYRPMGERGAYDTIDSGLTAGAWEPYRLEVDGPGKDEVPDPPGEIGSRQVDLMPFLDRSYVMPEPSVGGELPGTRHLLYPGRWHTLIATTGAGKSFWALWHVVSEMRKGNLVVYAHFEEALPVMTLDRLRSMAPEMSVETIVKQFIWLDCTRRWEPGEFEQALPPDAVLVVLDGINAAATGHRMEVNAPEAVSAYRAQFVTPATARGMAVLSLGHPPKARDRQDERHGFGSSAWLDEVDGVGFRMVPVQASPIRRGQDGASDIYSVKDRGGAVEARGHLDGGTRREGWTYLGRFHVDGGPEHANLSGWMSTPSRAPDATPADAIDDLGAAIVRLLGDDGRFNSQVELHGRLRAAKVSFADADVAPALERLYQAGEIEWPPTNRGRGRPGWRVKIAAEVNET
jgi:hypothetical protein